MIKNISINDTILQLIDYKYNKNKRKFAKSINVAPQVISNIVSGRKSKHSYDIIRAILSTYDDINPEWLITGKGDMIRDTNKVQEELALYKKPPQKDDMIDFLKNQLIKKDEIIDKLLKTESIEIKKNDKNISNY